jgi:protocatechuate 3,4-dioxygenase beta subunit
MKKTAQVTRREILKRLGGVLAVVPLAHMLACSEDGSAGGEDMAGGLDLSEADMGADQTEVEDQGEDQGAAVAWATGGTAAMVGKALYPNPFVGEVGTSCALHCQTTIGPCHTLSPLRADVSDGLTGLPVRLALRVVDDACEPVEDAIVEIWHTNHLGIYSGEINTMCNKEEEDRAAQYFRGYLRTDADGRVDFDTCFPGWYRGRMVHIHVRVMAGDYNAADGAAASVITQLVFPEALVASIFSEEPLYKEMGQPDTKLSSDNVMAGAPDDASQYTLEVSRMADGAMLASKTLVVRGSASGSLCSLGR